MKIFVTGATGVVGRRAVPQMIVGGHRVTAAGRNVERLAVLQHAGATVVSVDLLDLPALQRALTGHDAVVNLATHMPSSSFKMMLPGSFRENDRVRRLGSANLVNAAIAAGVKRFIQESFAPVYADGGARWLDETAPVRPARYNQTVLDAEHSANRFTASGGTGVVLRFALFYGPDSRLLRDMLDLMRKGIAPVPGAADAYASSLSHDDAARAVITALALPAGTYNVCDDEPLQRRDYLSAMARAFGLRTPGPMPRWASRLMGSAGELLSRSQRMSNRKLRAFGWTPQYPSARDGFRAIAAELEGASVGRPAAR